MNRKLLVVDANILMRGVLGTRVLHLLDTYADKIAFCSPEICFEEARRHLPSLLKKRGLDVDSGLMVLNQIMRIVEPIAAHVYQPNQQIAQQRIFARDPDDWPVVATAMFLECPIWTEDQDFFGSGIATWTTDRVELFLSQE